VYTVSKAPLVVISYYLQKHQNVDSRKHKHRDFVELVVGNLVYRVYAEDVYVVDFGCFQNLNARSSPKDDK